MFLPIHKTDQSPGYIQKVKVNFNKTSYKMRIPAVLYTAHNNFRNDNSRKIQKPCTWIQRLNKSVMQVCSDKEIAVAQNLNQTEESSHTPND